MSQYIFPSITEQVTVSGTLHIATVAAGAMFFHDSIDFSAYANRGYKLEFKDAAGKKAWAFGGAAGSGETLGDEELQTWTNVTSREFDTLNTAGTNITSAIEDGSVASAASNAFVHTLTNGAIYKKELSLTLNSGATPAHNLYYSPISSQQLTFGAIISGSSYFTAPTGLCKYLTLYMASATVTNFTLDASLKPLTNVPVTGLLLNSTPFGTDRTMAGSESGFNPNTVVLVRILGSVKIKRY